MDQNSQNDVLINNARTTNAILSSLDNLFYNEYIIFQKGVVNFKIKHKTCLFLVRGAVPP